MASVPAFAQSECPEGTSKEGPDGSVVTCEADTTSSEPAPSDPAGNQSGGAALDNTDAGQGVKDAVTEDATSGGNN